jgi:Flp pilus assembly protein TadD
MFVSTDGRTFQEPPADWKPGRTNRPAGQFGSGSQSMAADLVREGATGVSAHVSEPYLDATIRPQILFPAYLAGFNLAEAFYLAMPFLGWQTMILGDPLVAPFRDAPLPPDSLHRGIDPETELPAIFAERRLRQIATGGLRLDALKMVLRADARLARDDEAGAEELMARAVDTEPRLVGTAMRVAAAHEKRGEHEQARARYEGILKVDPNHVLALNNLAYSLAVQSGAPKDALPLAERAYRRSNLAVVADTVGWIHHLLGDDRAALPYLERAVAGAPDVAEIQFHAAVVHASVGQLARARTELAAALKLDPALSEREEIVALQAKLGGS